MIVQENKAELLAFAGEYVLGTLQGEARDMFERQLATDFDLQSEVADWEQRLSPLAASIEPVVPPDSIWRRIETDISPHESQSPGWWDSLNFWRNLGMVASGVVLGLTLSLFGLQQDEGELQRVMVVLNDQAQTGWLVGAGETGKMLRVSAVEPTRLQPGRVCQLWMETEDGRMLSVGVLPHSGRQQMKVPTLLRANSRFKVSIEAASEAPVAKPSGEFVFEGGLTQI